MRWPFRRRRNERSVELLGSRRQAPALPPAPPAPRDWARLPALAPTVSMWPVTLSPALRTPGVAGTRRMTALTELRHPRPARQAGSPTTADAPHTRQDALPAGLWPGMDRLPAPPPPGVVNGLVVPRPLPDGRPRSDAPVADYPGPDVDTEGALPPSEPAQLRRVPVTRHEGAGTARPELTKAVDEYVGQPYAPAEQSQAWEEQGGTPAPEQFYEDLRGMGDAGAALAALAAISRDAGPLSLPSAPPGPAEPDQDRPSRPVRRASLSQSRRLGLDGRASMPHASDLADAPGGSEGEARGEPDDSGDAPAAAAHPSAVAETPLPAEQPKDDDATASWDGGTTGTIPRESARTTDLPNADDSGPGAVEAGGHAAVGLPSAEPDPFDVPSTVPGPPAPVPAQPASAQQPPPQPLEGRRDDVPSGPRQQPMIHRSGAPDRTAPQFRPATGSAMPAGGPQPPAAAARPDRRAGLGAPVSRPLPAAGSAPASPETAPAPGPAPESSGSPLLDAILSGGAPPPARHPADAQPLPHPAEDPAGTAHEPPQPPSGTPAEMTELSGPYQDAGPGRPLNSGQASFVPPPTHRQTPETDTLNPSPDLVHPASLGIPASQRKESEAQAADHPVGVVYRASLAPLPARVQDADEDDRGTVGRSTGGRRTETPPPEIASDLRSALGIDISGIPIHRGPGVSRQARALNARAFTTGGEVFLPDEAGPVSDPGTRALLGHELVHAAQQRMLGASQPAEDSAHGQQLEQVAVDTEEWLNGRRSAPLPLTHPATRTAQPSGEPTGQAAVWQPPPLDPSVWSTPLPTAMQRAAEQSAPATEPFGAFSTAWATAGEAEPQVPAVADTMMHTSSSTPFVWSDGTDGLTTPPGLVGSTSTVSADSGEFIALRDAVTELKASVTALREQPLPDTAPAFDSPSALDELADRLLPRMRLGLRHELLIDRERAGLLSDFGHGRR